MDERRFDAALRALQAETTRRRGLAGMLAVLLGGRAIDAAARERKRETAPGTRKPAAAGPCGDGSALANKCRRDSTCCTKYCAEGSCRCKPNWMECGNASECCSRRCVKGRCDGGAKPAGAACRENFNCQSGLACIRRVCTRSPKATCNRQNCNGCCAGTTCRAGTTESACGPKGGTCARCAAGKRCRNGVCKGTGCTANSQCTGSSDTCLNGICGCGSGPKCSGATPICTAGVCTAAEAWTQVATFGSHGSNADQFLGPRGMFLSADMLMLWVVDEGNARVSIWTRSDVTSTWTHAANFGQFGSNPDQFYQPFAIWLSADELTAWIADTANNRISVWSRPDVDSTSWSPETTFGTEGNLADNLKAPSGVFVSPDGLTVWVADTGNDRVSVWGRDDDSSTTWTNRTTFGTSGSADDQFYFPKAVVASSDGKTAWVGEMGSISAWTRPDTTSTTAWTHLANFASYSNPIGQNNPNPAPDTLNLPSSVIVSADGLTAWIADSGHERVVIWSRPDATGNAWSVVTTFGSGQMFYPGGIAVSADGLTIWVSEASSDGTESRVSVWALT